MCSAFNRHTHNFIEKANFSNRPITYVEIVSLLICLVSSNRCTCSFPMDIDLTLLRSRHPRTRRALNIWHLELLLDLCSLFATCRNHKWEIKWGLYIMFKQYTSSFGVFFTDIEITIFANVLRSECEMETDDVKSD